METDETSGFCPAVVVRKSKTSEYLNALCIPWSRVQFVWESHHCYDWSRAHVADQFLEERFAPQVPVVFPKKILRCLMRRTRKCTLLYWPWSKLFRKYESQGRVKKSTPPNTCMSLTPTSLNPFLSKRRMISPTSLRCTPSGFTAMKVRSFTPVQPRPRDICCKN